MDAILLGHGLDVCAWAGTARPSTMQLDPLPLAGALLARTQRIGVVAGWTVDFSEPFHVARVLATLDHLSYGRSGWLAQMFGTAALTPRIGRSLGTEIPPIIGSGRTNSSTQFKSCGTAGRTKPSRWTSRAACSSIPSACTCDHHGRCFTIRGPLNVPRPPQGHPVLVHTDPDNADGRRLVVSTADVILTRYGTAAETAARSWELRRDRDRVNRLACWRISASCSRRRRPRPRSVRHNSTHWSRREAPYRDTSEHRPDWSNCSRGGQPKERATGSICFPQCCPMMLTC